MNSAKDAYEYCVAAKKRVPELEVLILEHDWYTFLYTLELVKERWPAAEKTILQSEKVTSLLYYAKHIIKGRWLEAEAIMFEGDFNKRGNHLMVEYYLTEFPDTHKAQSKTTTPVMIHGRIITGVPNTISDDQLVDLIFIVFKHDENWNGCDITKKGQIQKEIIKERTRNEQIILNVCDRLVESDRVCLTSEIISLIDLQKIATFRDFLIWLGLRRHICFSSDFE